MKETYNIYSESNKIITFGSDYVWTTIDLEDLKVMLVWALGEGLTPLGWIIQGSVMYERAVITSRIGDCLFNIPIVVINNKEWATPAELICK